MRAAARSCARCWYCVSGASGGDSIRARRSEGAQSNLELDNIGTSRCALFGDSVHSDFDVSQHDSDSDTDADSVLAVLGDDSFSEPDLAGSDNDADSVLAVLGDDDLNDLDIEAEKADEEPAHDDGHSPDDWALPFLYDIAVYCVCVASIFGCCYWLAKLYDEHVR